MKYRIAYITKSDEFKSKNFETKEELDNFIFEIMTEIRRGRYINKETKETWTVEL
tara:strand:- start:179 stop:343 length:165 start_codon:yes stop_codon:yes gene_type:complete